MDKIKSIILLAAVAMLFPIATYAQFEGTSNRYIRVAEVGQLADSVNVWGDVTNAGRYIIPQGTNLPDLISFAFGYTQLRGRESDINWSKTRIEVKVSRYNKKKEMVEVALFRYKYKEPEPVKMFQFDLQNNDIVTIQVRRMPSFTDYVNVVAPVLSVMVTSIFLVDNIRNRIK